MKKLLACIVLCLVPLSTYADEVKLTVKADKVLHQLDEKIYGHFLEHIFNSCNNGIWGDLVWNRSFEYSSNGDWKVEDGTLRQTAFDPECLQYISEPDLKDYEFTFEARKIDGGEGFLIPFHYQSESTAQWINLGGWGNTEHALDCRGYGDVCPKVRGSIEKGRWYKISLKCEGSRVTLTLDDKVIFDVDSPHNLTWGNVGVGSWGTQVEFRNFKITRKDGSEAKITLKSKVRSPRFWEVYGDTTTLVEETGALNDKKSLRISVKGDGGIYQDKFNFQKGETYQGSLWASGDNLASLYASVSDITDNALKQSGELRTKKIGSKTWTEIPLEFTAKEDNQNGVVKIGFKGGGTISLDQVSFMPKSWKEKHAGMRPDLVQAMDELKAPVIRWPGGCYASCYLWKDGIGPQEDRKANDRDMWDDRDPNSFGTDEFMKLCKRLGTQPIMVMNVGSEHWYPADYDRSGLVQDALDWIEYCNGSVDTKWGKIRAENGHPEPYNILYWEIDNETWGWPVEKYAAAVNELGSMIRKKYPDLKILACGSNGFSYDHPFGWPWNKYIVDHCAENFDYLSIHHYEGPDNFDRGAREYEEFIGKHRELFANSKNPNLKMYCSEWNAQAIDWRTGLYCGGMLNGFERVGDIFEIGGPALFLRHIRASAWNNAFINFNNKSWFAGANYVVMKLYREHYAPNLLALEGDQKKTNCVATRSEDGKDVILKFVNPTENEKQFVVNLGDFTASTASMQLVHPDDLLLKNTFEEPNKIAPKSADIKVDGNTVRFTLPKLSVGVAKISQ